MFRTGKEELLHCCDRMALGRKTVMAIAGHMSRKMMERYSHARNEAKR